MDSIEPPNKKRKYNRKKCGISLQKLPDELQIIIVSFISTFQTVYALSQTCTRFHRICVENPNIYDNLLTLYLTRSSHQYPEIFINSFSTSFDALNLLSNTGCQRCGKNNIRKIYVEFRIRICELCLKTITIKDYELLKYGINYSLIATLQSIQISFWISRWNNGSYNLYLCSDIKKIIGCSIEQHKQNLINNAIERLKLSYPDIIETDFLQTTLLTIEIHLRFERFLSLFVKPLIWKHRVLKLIKTKYSDLDVNNLQQVVMIKQMIKTAITNENLDEDEINNILSSEKIRKRIRVQASKK